MLRILGPKSSACCAVLSAWGVVFMFFLGVAFWLRSPALIEDLELPEEPVSDDDIFEAYKAAGTNCILTALAYVLTIFWGWRKINFGDKKHFFLNFLFFSKIPLPMLFSIWQIYENNKRQPYLVN